MEQSPDERIEELERLVSALRHDLRGIITPASLVAEGLRRNADPVVQRAAARISDTIDRIVSRLNETCELVPPSGRSGPVIGADGRASAATAIGSGRKA
jgi:signal transduction histidine kinase